MQEQTIDRIEAELNRLRAARPHLDSRIDRAEHILTTQLSVRNGSRPIKARISGGQRTYLVKGSGGAVYRVDPDTFGCSCPDAHRRGKGCKHAVAVYALDRACRRADRPKRVRPIEDLADTLRGAAMSGRGREYLEA